MMILDSGLLFGQPCSSLCAFATNDDGSDQWRS